VVEAERLNGQAVGEGTEFRLVAEFLGRKNELTYRIVVYDPHAVTHLPASVDVTKLEVGGKSRRHTRVRGAAN
jgi:hypothetical protein